MSKRHIRQLVITGLSFGSFVAVLGSLGVYHVLTRTADVPEALREAHAVGIPTSEEAFAEFLGGTDDGTASEAVGKIEAVFVEHTPSLQYSLARNLDEDELRGPDFRRAMTNLEPALSLVDDLAKRDACRFPIEPNEGGVRFLEVRTLRNAGRVLANRAKMHALDGQDTQAFDDIITIRLLARHMRDQHSFRHLMCSIALDATAMTALADFITYPGASENLVSEAAHILAAYDVEADLQKTFRGEAYVHWSITGTAPLKDDDPLAVFKRVEQDFIRREVLAYHVAKIRTITDAGDDLKKIQLASEEHKNSYTAIEPAMKFVVAKSDASQAVLLNYERNVARLKMMVAVAEIGERVASVDPLPAALTLRARDPYADRTLRYVPVEDGFDIISVGRDGVDDKGATGRAFSDLQARSDLVLSIRSGQRPRLRGR